MEKKSPSPKRKGGKAGKTKAASKPMATGPLPIVKPADYEVFLQGYLNAHPKIGWRKLLAAFGDSLHVTCTEWSIRTWLDHHAAIIAEQDIADHEDFLWEQLRQ